MPNRLASVRQAQGLTQSELADRAGVSRQLIGSVENGRHSPRVEAAIAIATALHSDVTALFGSHETGVDVLTGEAPADGTFVRATSVGDRRVTAQARIGSGGWDVADAVVAKSAVEPFDRTAGGIAVAGCEPGLELLERILREHSMSAVAAATSSRTAVGALAAGRLHAAVVHGTSIDSRDDLKGLDVVRFHIGRWAVGLAAPLEMPGEWWLDALSGGIPVIQREEGAGVQQAFEAAKRTDATTPGPRVATHVEAARSATSSGLPAITIEPAARAVGASFYELEVHDAQLVVDKQWLGERSVVAALDVISSARFQRRLESVGGYDLAGCGDRVA